jgi:hypothetical protein
VNLGHYLRLLHRSQTDLASAFREVATTHRDEPDVFHECQMLGSQSDRHAERLAPFVDRYGDVAPVDDEPDRLHSELFSGTRSGPLALLRDLQDLYLMATECDIVWTLIGQAAQGARDGELLDVVQGCEGETSVQLRWLATRLKQAAPQALVVSS